MQLSIHPNVREFQFTIDEQATQKTHNSTVESFGCVVGTVANSTASRNCWIGFMNPAQPAILLFPVSRFATRVHDMTVMTVRSTSATHTQNGPTTTVFSNHE